MASQSPIPAKEKPAVCWKLRTRTLAFSSRPLIMGIVNVTPDSFSDGGRFFSPSAAIEHGLRLEAEGADLLDIGGESTRPYAQPVSADDERKRVEQTLRSLVQQCRIPISIDTSKASVAKAALEAGVEIINDVTGLEGDPAMLRVGLEFGAAVCAMHMQGGPQTMQDNPQYHDSRHGGVTEEIFAYLQQRRDALLHYGIEKEKICLDPGVGFGKTHQHNLTLLANCGRFLDLGQPLLVGHSHKGFIGKVLGDKEASRIAGSVGVALSLARQSVQILRVHDVAATRQALELFLATGGLDRDAGRIS